MKLTSAKIFMALVFAVSLTACAGSGNNLSTGEYIDSAAITAKVKTELALADETSALQIDVETYKDLVILSGFVDSEAERIAAERIAADVNGVAKVKNALVVKS